MTIAAVLERLDHARQAGPGRWRARCPAHDSESLTLSLREAEDGTTLMHCFAGCEIDSILAAVGLERRDLFPVPHRPSSDRPVRYTTPAAQRLASLTAESLVVLVVAEDVASGKTPGDQDMARLRVAIERIQGARYV